ncbi:MAG: phosphotransferase family protein [Lachnospiraceae bacterium]|nr:phosphotransferase family protein [Lachnospiraceae bacterium]
MKIEDFAEVIKIEKGWSNEKKYKVVDKSGQAFLLRISPIEQYENKKAEYENMEMVSALGISMCQPIEFGTCDEGVYSLQSWIDGKDAEEAIVNLSDKQVYEYGYEAGEILKKLHSIVAPEGIGNWEDFFNQKMNRKIENYNNCPLKYEGGDAFITYIEEHRHLLKHRPMTYQHGDYHIGNMMIESNGKLVIIDFNRNEYGDPWEEFNRIVWCAQSAPLFATGMVDGYFDCNVPQLFWDLLALYISSNTLSSLPWAIPFGQKEIDVMINLAKDVLDWYDGMKNTVPKWYRNSGGFCK